MNDIRPLLVLGTVLGLLLAGTGAAAAGIAGPASQPVQESPPVHQTEPTTSANATNDSSTVSPGARLSGVVGVGQAELQGEVAARSMGHALNASDSNASRATVIAASGDRLEAQLAALETELADLEAAHRNGTISQGAYQAQAATLTARTNVLERALERTANEGTKLPENLREQHGVNVTRLSELRAASGNLTGPEVAAIARTVAGPNPGHGPANRGPPAHAGPGSSMGPTSGNTTPAANRSGPGHSDSGPGSGTDSAMDPTTGPPTHEGGPDAAPDDRTAGPPSDSEPVTDSTDGSEPEGMGPTNRTTVATGTQ